MQGPPPTPARAIGRHCLLDCGGCDVAKLRDEAFLRNALAAAAVAGGMTVLAVTSHKFDQGGGVTAIALLSESHLSIHTWPEDGYAAIDAFTCGGADATAACAALADALGARSRRRQHLPRDVPRA